MRCSSFGNHNCHFEKQVLVPVYAARKTHKIQDLEDCKCHRNETKLPATETPKGDILPPECCYSLMGDNCDRYQNCLEVVRGV